MTDAELKVSPSRSSRFDRCASDGSKHRQESWFYCCLSGAILFSPIVYKTMSETKRHSAIHRHESSRPVDCEQCVLAASKQENGMTLTELADKLEALDVDAFAALLDLEEPMMRNLSV